jgi:hypothetical protein
MSASGARVRFVSRLFSVNVVEWRTKGRVGPASLQLDFGTTE